MRFNNTISHIINSLYNISSIIVSVWGCIILGIINQHVTALPVEYYAEHSVLATGKWHKIEITDDGIYQISYEQLKKWGFNNPSQVRIYGYGGNMLPETYSTEFCDDLPQIPIIHNNNRILFYGKGTIKWYWDEAYNRMRHRQNPYSVAAYYFITESNVEQATTQPAPLSGNTTNEVISVYDGITLHEQELASMSKTGQMFFGEDFRYTQTREFKFSTPGIVTESPMNVEVAFGAKISGSTGSLRFYHNGSLVSSASSWKIAANSDATYEFMKYIKPNVEVTSNEGNDNFTLTYQTSGTTINARLDYILLSYKRNLQLYNGSVQFRINRHNIGDNICIKNVNENCIIWDIEKSHAPRHITAQISNNQAIFAPAEASHTYIAFDPAAKFATPRSVGDIANQDLHNMEIPDMVILAPAQYIKQAQQVAALHESIDSMKVAVINHELIFNEFSSGAPDAVAYRRFLKMFYDRGNVQSDRHRLKYLLLFGRGFYDNRRLSSEIKNCGFPTLLTYQNPRSENETYSYTTDDFFTYLEDNTTSRNSINLMSISVGRFPVKSEMEADIVVEKLYKYVTKPNYGTWRNQAIVIADDGNSNTHIQQAENAISQMLIDNPHLIVNKIYIDAFAEQQTSTGRSFPDAKKKMMQLLDEGQLTLTYVGHANSVGWTGEDLLNINDIKNLYIKNLPFMFTATCDFSRFDSEEVSGGEYFFLNEFGGAISLFSSTRVAWINENGRLSSAIGNHLYQRDENNNYPRTGDVIKNAKNQLTGQFSDNPSKFVADSNKLVYALLGDPAMRLGYPSHQAQITRINGLNLGEDITLMARSDVSLEGRILTPNGEEDNTFNGSIFVTLYDAAVITTSNGYDDCPKKQFEERNNKLFSGKANVNNGRFSLSFHMPKETSMSNKNALISLYAYSIDGIEAAGSCIGAKIGGIHNTSETDTIGPDITYLYLNTSNFSDGDIVNESPMLFAAISDSSGINLSSSGIGHNMSITIDGKDNFSDVSSYYTPDTTGISGIISYPLAELQEGNHTLTLRVWDNEGNSSSSSIAFTVMKGKSPEIYKVYADQNPARTSTNFYLEHDRPDGIITVTLSIYNLMGMPVWRTEKQGRSDMFKTFPITWDLTFNGGGRVPGGIYIYQATISTDKTHITTKTQKLCVAPSHR